MESGNLENSTSQIKKAPASNKKVVKFAKNSPKNKKLVVGLVSLLFLVMGGVIGLYLTKTSQDLRQQADTGSYTTGCTLGSCPEGQTCHCQDGNACTITACEDDILIDRCKWDGREYCVNVYGQANTCCAAGYGCCANGPGCCPNGNPTNPPSTITPTTPHTTITVTPSPTTTITPTPTTSLVQCGYGPCFEDADCADNGLGVICTSEDPYCTDSGLGVICITANDGQGYCGIDVEAYGTKERCQADPNEVNCCTFGPSITPTTPVGPQCLDIKMFDLTNGQSEIMNMSENDDDNLVKDQSIVRFVCSSVDGPTLPAGYFYAFRVYEPCGSGNHYEPLEFINNEGENGINYSVGYSGDYMAQCAICEVDDAGDTVCGWESLTPAACEGTQE